MKVIKVFFTIIGCAIIAFGAYSAVDFMLARDFAPEEEVVAVPEEEVLPEEPVVEEEPEAEPEEEVGDPEETARLTRAQELLDGMSQDEKIYQLMFVSPEAVTGVETATQAGDATKSALADYPVGGLYYGQLNVLDAEQLSALTSNTVSYMAENGSIAPFMGIYEDGSSISPLVSFLNGEALDSFSAVGETANTGEATQLAVDLSEALVEYNFNANFASGVDLFDADTAFGTDGAAVAEMAGAYVTGMHSQNVAAVLGHFPGEGSSLNAETEQTLEDFMANDILPFAAGMEAGACMIQVSNMTATDLDYLPCCLSSVVMDDLLRNELGYSGVIIADPLGGVTISAEYDPNEAAVMALEAGADMVFGLTDPAGAHDSIAAAIEDGTLTAEQIDASVLRILCAKLQLGIIE